MTKTVYVTVLVAAALLVGLFLALPRRWVVRSAGSVRRWLAELRVRLGFPVKFTSPEKHQDGPSAAGAEGKSTQEVTGNDLLCLSLISFLQESHFVTSIWLGLACEFLTQALGEAAAVTDEVNEDPRCGAIDAVRYAVALAARDGI